MEAAVRVWPGRGVVTDRAAQDWLPEPLPPRGGLEADWLGMVRPVLSPWEAPSLGPAPMPRPCFDHRAPI